MTLDEMAAVAAKNNSRYANYPDAELIASYGWFLSTAQTTLTIMQAMFRAKRYDKVMKNEDVLDNEIISLYAIRGELKRRIKALETDKHK